MNRTNEKYQRGLALWLEQTLDNYQTIRKTSFVGANDVEDDWEAFINLPYEDDGCKVTHTTGIQCQAIVAIRNPVIFGGSNRCTWLGIPYQCEGHAWVCDGYHYFGDECYFRFYYHMNWGWGGGYNGYFSFGNFNPGGNNFNYKVQIIKNIHP